MIRLNNFILVLLLDLLHCILYVVICKVNVHQKEKKETLMRSH